MSTQATNYFPEITTSLTDLSKGARHRQGGNAPRKFRKMWRAWSSGNRPTAGPSCGQSDIEAVTLGFWSHCNWILLLTRPIAPGSDEG